MYVREICADLGYDMSEPSIIYEDNKACISISEGDTDKKRTKHIAKHFHFVKEKRAAGLVSIFLKGVGGTASSVVHHCSFYDGAYSGGSYR